jgi:hypothetical protein
MPDCLARILRPLGDWSPAGDQTSDEVRGNLRQGNPALPQSIRRCIRWLLSYEDYAVASTDELFVEIPGKGPTPDARARQLLLRVLNPVQRDEFSRYGYFTVDAVGWGRFRVLSRTTFNVLNTGTGLAFCAGPDIPVPLADLMLAQKLILENDPGRFFRVANHRREGGRCSGADL